MKRVFLYIVLYIGVVFYIGGAGLLLWGVCTLAAGLLNVFDLNYSEIGKGLVHGLLLIGIGWGVVKLAGRLMEYSFDRADDQ